MESKSESKEYDEWKAGGGVVRSAYVPRRSSSSSCGTHCRVACENTAVETCQFEENELLMTVASEAETKLFGHDAEVLDHAHLLDILRTWATLRRESNQHNRQKHLQQDQTHEKQNRDANSKIRIW